MADFSNILVRFENVHHLVMRPDNPKLQSVFDLGAVDNAPVVAPNPPTVANITPAPGTSLSSATFVGLDVTDAEGFGRVRVFAEYPNGDYEIVYDGTRFANKYKNSSYLEVISGGYRFNIRPNAGWTANPTITVDSTDSTGLENT